jgi:hypothetical protein
MRLPLGVVKSIHHVLPRLKSDIDTPFSKSLATLAEEKHKTIANSQQGHYLKIPSTYLSWHRALSQPSHAGEVLRDATAERPRLLQETVFSPIPIQAVGHHRPK